MRIQINNPIDDQTNEVYTFNLFDMTAVFIAYHKEVKPKGKRKWRIVGYWDNYNKRESNIEQPVLPENVRIEAKAKIMDLCNIKTWQEYKAIY